MSSRASRRRKKINSDNDSLISYSYDEVAVTGPLPYEDFYDYSPNGIHYIINGLDFVDNNDFEFGNETGLFYVEKL